MGDFFDIANLITKVGVDAIKIKPEPGLPEKSSNEILTELFSTFDTEEGIVSPDNTDQQVPNAAVKSEKSDKAATKKKKSKKKHKHKEKKHKKKFKHNSSESQSDTESVDVKRRKKHKKKSKHKSVHNSTKSSESDEPKAKIRKLEDPIEDLKRKLSNKVEVESKETIAEEESKSSDSYRKKLSCFQVPPVFKSLQEEPEEPLIQKILEKPKQSVAGKIQIKDLKNSTVYNETVKEIEIKKKAKAARMEDGELSDSSMDNRTPTLSSPSPHSSLRSPSLSPLRSRKKHRARSHDRSIPGTKNDLRLILKEKEKRRMEVTEKNRGHIDSDKDTKDDYYKHKKRSRSSKRSYEPRSPERTRSESQTRSNSHRSRSRGRDRHRDRSKDRRDRSRSYERRESRRSRERKRHRSNSEDRSRERYARGRSRSKERKERIEIDKKKLLEIARKNAINMIKQGTLPLAQQDKAIAAIQAGGKTVDELTDFCKSLSKSEALGELSSISSDDDESGSDKGFHHPFLIKERPSSIILNIKDAKQLPTKTFQEKTAESCNQLRLQFPVSSGQHHRKTESEWIPVIPKKAEPKKPVPPPPPPVEPTVIPCPVPILPAPLQPAVFPQQPIIEQLDIGTIVSQRLAAMRKLRENPNDESALKDMYRAQNEMTTWAESKQMPGQFTGSTGAKLLSPAELTSGYQAWARKDQLVSAQPVSGGMGMALLQKMGWRPGEGLGKNKEGTLEPLQLEVKLDKRGLVSDQDVGQRIGKAAKPVVPAIKTLEGKHPVSLLGEYCSKRKIGAPVYELCFECGPDHRKNFLFKVRVNGIEYKPTVASPNKKQAKAEAAQICLQTLGLLPEPQPPPNLTTGT